MKHATIIGSGLVGSLWAIYLNKAGYKVSLLERRGDMRKQNLSAGKSINLAISYRGWKALDAVGVGDIIRKTAIPMYGRTVHSIDGKTSFQAYGINNQAIYSVSRGEINARLMDIAESSGMTELYFDSHCTGVDIDKNMSYFEHNSNGIKFEIKSDVIFAADGAFSSVRYNSMQKHDRFSYSQNYIEDGYKEILLPSNSDGSHKLDKNSLHIWPRGRFMLIALPNPEGSFTCTLFMPFDNHKYCFNNLKTKHDIIALFREMFADFYELMPEIADTWKDHPTSSLAIIRCFPWHYNKTVLMGDAAHATVPFYGQGMNAGFEDCTVMFGLMEQYGDDWNACFEAYEKIRKPNGDAVQDLSLQNYLIMRDKVNDPDFILQQKVEKRIHELYPDQYLPLYSMVSFSDIEYHTALEQGKKQDADMRDFIEKHQITPEMTEIAIDEIIHKALNKEILV
ncbi:MAG: FAD-dependent monooxygenase [Bacteroidia bacterium]|nr:FAD-dependent monooxygenase [Bacteroidia bacterium]